MARHIVTEPAPLTSHTTPLRPGAVVPRPPRERAQAHPGVFPLTPFAPGSQKFQALPDPLGQPPYHYDLATALPAIAARCERLGKVVFYTVGDTEGIKHPDYQARIATRMKTDLTGGDGTAPMFFYHLGDVVYYNGAVEEYYPQFYEP